MVKAISLLIMFLVAIEVDGVESYTYVSSEDGSAVIMESPETSAPQRRRRRRSRRNRDNEKDSIEANAINDSLKAIVKAQEPKVVRICLDSLTSDYTANNGEVISGKLGQYQLTIADKATVVLEGVDITDIPQKPTHKFAGITCEGDATIILSKESTNKVMGGYENYPGIYVPENNTLTIKGSGSLECSSQGWGAGIGGGKDLNCGDIVIEEGSITAVGGKNAAAIGSGWFANCGDIVIKPTATSVTVIKHKSGGLDIGAGKDGTCGTKTIADSIIK